jgi:O-antigen ligase
MKRVPDPPASFASNNAGLAAMVCFGALLGLTLLKFNNPPIMERLVSPPTDVFEFVLDNPWPIRWGYALLALATLLAFLTAKLDLPSPLWLVLLPGVWLFWQLVASFGTIRPDLTYLVLAHFAACVVCFYIGLFCSSNSQSLNWILPGLLCAFLVVLAVGWQQHFGGLEQTRKYFFTYLYPKLKEVPPEYLKKLSSNRIFSTLFYPNALAGAILLLLPVVLQWVWEAKQRFTDGARSFLVAVIGIAALGCLYWSGSKGGWLLMLVLGVLWLLRRPFSKQLKQTLVIALVVVGLIAFFWRYSGFFQKGATSVSARFDYWRAAATSTLAHPLIGTGPGTFSITYQNLKRPESEMARLAHNDYLQQASDSGLPGFLLYTGSIAALLTVTYPRARASQPGAGTPPPHPGAKLEMESPRLHDNPMATSGRESSLWFAVWLGALGWALQSLVEFSLYIPALAWPAFAFLGLLLRRRFRAS